MNNEMRKNKYLRKILTEKDLSSYKEKYKVEVIEFKCNKTFKIFDTELWITNHHDTFKYKKKKKNWHLKSQLGLELKLLRSFGASSDTARVLGVTK